jgi:hypothetical protein
VGVALRLCTNEISMVSEIDPLLTIGCLSEIESDVPVEIHIDATQGVWVLDQEPVPEDAGNIILPGSTCFASAPINSADRVLGNDFTVDVLEHTGKVSHVDVFHGVWTFTIELLRAVHVKLHHRVVGRIPSSWSWCHHPHCLCWIAGWCCCGGWTTGRTTTTTTTTSISTDTVFGALIP